MKTLEEVENLKTNWLRDPEWDIEDTEGFEEYHDELKAFSEQKKVEWGKARGERVIAKKNIWYALDLNQSFSLSGGKLVTRVPGGWVMEVTDNFNDENGCSTSSVFIPYSEEFKVIKP